jgi:hypothetical protein
LKPSAQLIKTVNKDIKTKIVRDEATAIEEQDIEEQHKERYQPS